jgi:hypothetical protein
MVKVKSRATLTHGTARDLADHGVGYTASGEGEWSRSVARPGNIKLNGYDEPIPRYITHQPHPRTHIPGDTIGLYRHQIKKMKARLREETDPARIAKLHLGIKIKTDLIARRENND